jgi:Fuc2NAc and GlcNAc transferase
MSVLGFCDDLFDLSPLIRILVQFALCLSCLVLVWPLYPVVSDRSGEGFRLLSIGVASVWCVWMLNLYNFMDGIDGLAGGEAAVASLFFFILFARNGEPGWAVANLMVAASAAGFLVYNWPPAKVFMGDSGSAFLGAFYGMQSLIVPVTTGIPFIVLVLPFSNFILDATATLFLRIYRGEKWYQAHRSHVYQRMTNLGLSHRKVTSLELLTVAASCVAAAICMRIDIFGRIALVALVFAGLSVAGFSVIRKENDSLVGR